MEPPTRPHGTPLHLIWQVNVKAADSIADPIDYPNLFEGLEHALKVAH